MVHFSGVKFKKVYHLKVHETKVHELKVHESKRIQGIQAKLTISQVIKLWTPKNTLHINCGEFKYEFISSRGTNSQILLLDGVDVALNGVQPVARSASLCSV